MLLMWDRGLHSNMQCTKATVTETVIVAGEFLPIPPEKLLGMTPI